MSQSTNLAIHTNRDITNVKHTLFKNWESFLEGKQLQNDMRPEVYQSWKRCQNYDVNPMQKEAPVTIKEDDLRQMIKQSKLFTASLPIIDRLDKQISGTEHLITLSDQDGRIIHLKGDNDTIGQAEKMNFIVGADWSEKKAGSNAIGTSLAIGKPVQIFSFEHFCQGVHPWVCSAAPIHDPFSQKILGVIDLTGPSELAQSHSLSVVQSVSKLIEHQLFINSQHLQEKLIDYYEKFKRRRPSSTVLILNSDLYPVKVDDKCLTLFDCNHLQQFLKHHDLQRLLAKIKIQPYAEFQWRQHSLQLNIFIQPITYQASVIGYQVLFEKKISTKHRNISNTHTPLWKNIVTRSPMMYNIINKMQIVSDTSVPILITGESGTGKEVLSLAIHQHSRRKEKPFITVNCGAIPEHLIASELFGYEPGAFTGGSPGGKKGKFEEANGGTILLDEIGEMPVDLQVHLLRVLEEQEVVRLGSAKPIPLDVRVITATNQNIPQLIKRKLFREDLYYRLNVVEVNLPPLRQRLEDIPLLCDFFTKTLAKEHNRVVPILSKDVLDLFEQYEWKGNIRELKNVIEFAVLFNEENTITIESLPNQFLNRVRGDKDDTRDNPLSLLEREERKKIKKLLFETGGNISEVARRCGVARSTLYRKLKKYDL